MNAGGKGGGRELQSLLYVEVDALCVLILLYVMRGARPSASSPMSSRAFWRSAIFSASLFVSDAAWALLDGRAFPLSREINFAANVAYMFSACAAPLSWLIYVCACSGDSPARVKKIFRLCLIPLAALTALSLASYKTGWIFEVGPDCVYRRGPLCWIQTCVCMAFISLASVRALTALKRERGVAARERLALLAMVSVLPALGGVCQMVVSEVQVAWVCAALSLLIVRANAYERVGGRESRQIVKTKLLDSVSLGALSLIAIAVFVFIGVTPYGSWAERDAHKLVFEGTYQTEADSSPVELTPDNIPDASTVSGAVFRGHFTTDVEKGERIFLYTYKLDATLSVDGVTLEPLGYRKDEPKISFKWMCYLSPGITGESLIEINAANTSSTQHRRAFEMLLGSLAVGEAQDLLISAARSRMPQIIASILIFIVGIGLIASAATLKLTRSSVAGDYMACGLLIISGAVCTFIDYSYVLFLVDNALVVNMIDDLSQLAIFLTLLLYMRSHLGDRRIHTAMSFACYMWVAVAMAYLPVFLLGDEASGGFIDLCVPIATVLLMFACVCLIIDNRRDGDKRKRRIICSLMLLGACTFAEIFNYAATGMYWVFVFQAGLLVFTLVQISVMRESARESYQSSLRAREIEKELLQNKMSIMLSQIQPHFLFNALNTIGYLCGDEESLAGQAIDKFSKYLRGNMDSLRQLTPIPFEKELDHLNNYLYIEKLRFGNRLQIKYELEFTNFSLPALTVQPLVENSVRYGITQKDKGGTVAISARHIAGEAVVVISDDGVGFDPEKKPADGRSHIGIENVRVRLREMCGGELNIISAPGAGTVITIRLPLDEI